MVFKKKDLLSNMQKIFKIKKVKIYKLFDIYYAFIFESDNISYVTKKSLTQLDLDTKETGDFINDKKLWGSAFSKLKSILVPIDSSNSSDVLQMAKKDAVERKKQLQFEKDNGEKASIDESSRIIDDFYKKNYPNWYSKAVEERQRIEYETDRWRED